VSSDKFNGPGFEPVYLCPECAQGKCLNCSEQTLDEHDEWVPCGCTVHERRLT